MKLVATCLLALLVTACSSNDEPRPPTRGDLMMSQAQNAGALGRQWNDGSEMATKAEQERLDAERSLARAEKEAREARSTIEDAQRREAHGKKMMADAEAEFARRFPGQTLGGGTQ